ncbi:uncharacterized protein LOC101850488, partial [Aplysia californica]|uniref:Uncharacterized protein LOC101850488 n=1 Tax=Aplysia californica TaxID=6500 RepID=A0ABM1A3L7_APLCA
MSSVVLGKRTPSAVSLSEEDEDEEEKDTPSEDGRGDALYNKLICVQRAIVWVITSAFGLLLMNAAYLVAGAYVFYTVEAPRETLVQNTLENDLDLLAVRLSTLGTQDMDNASLLLGTYEDSLANFYRKRANVNVAVSNKTTKLWSPYGAAVFCLSVITTIGWGNVVPNSDLGKVATIIYSVFGIPLLFTLSSSMGTIINKILNCLWGFFRRRHEKAKVQKVKRRSTSSVASGESMDRSPNRRDSRSTPTADRYPWDAHPLCQGDGVPVSVGYSTGSVHSRRDRNNNLLTSRLSTSVSYMLALAKWPACEDTYCRPRYRLRSLRDAKMLARMFRHMPVSDVKKCLQFAGISEMDEGDNPVRGRKIIPSGLLQGATTVENCLVTGGAVKTPRGEGERLCVSSSLSCQSAVSKGTASGGGQRRRNVQLSWFPEGKGQSTETDVTKTDATRKTEVTTKADVTEINDVIKFGEDVTERLKARGRLSRYPLFVQHSPEADVMWSRDSGTEEERHIMDRTAAAFPRGLGSNLSGNKSRTRLTMTAGHTRRPRPVTSTDLLTHTGTSSARLSSRRLKVDPEQSVVAVSDMPERVASGTSRPAAGVVSSHAPRGGVSGSEKRSVTHGHTSSRRDGVSSHVACTSLLHRNTHVTDTLNECDECDRHKYVTETIYKHGRHAQVKGSVCDTDQHAHVTDILNENGRDEHVTDTIHMNTRHEHVTDILHKNARYPNVTDTLNENGLHAHVTDIVRNTYQGEHVTDIVHDKITHPSDTFRQAHVTDTVYDKTMHLADTFNQAHVNDTVYDKTTRLAETFSNVFSIEKLGFAPRIEPKRCDTRSGLMGSSGPDEDLTADLVSDKSLTRHRLVDGPDARRSLVARAVSASAEVMHGDHTNLSSSDVMHGDHTNLSSSDVMHGDHTNLSDVMHGDHTNLSGGDVMLCERKYPLDVMQGDHTHFYDVLLDDHTLSTTALGPRPSAETQYPVTSLGGPRSEAQHKSMTSQSRWWRSDGRVGMDVRSGRGDDPHPQPHPQPH